MQKRYAKKLHNRDQVEIRIDGSWVYGYILGDPILTKDNKVITFEVQTESYGLQIVNHLEIR
jgi:hypothetical protein